MSPRADGTAIRDILPTCGHALAAAERVEAAAKQAVSGLVAPDGQINPGLLEREQFAAHGLAWLATYVAALRESLRWAERLEQAGRLRELECLILQAAFGEYLQQMLGGIPISQTEIVRPADLGVDADALTVFVADSSVKTLCRSGNSAAARGRIAELIAAGADSGDFGDPGLMDDSLALVRDQFHRLADAHRDAAHRWHLDDDLIPIEVIEHLAELGVFGLTVPEAYGGLAMGKTAMCLVTEELSRGYIGLGSIGTRSEIAAELIRLGGTEAQKAR